MPGKQADEVGALTLSVFVVAFLAFYSVELFLGRAGQLSAVTAMLWGIA
jgi:hypothetical protein